MDEWMKGTLDNSIRDAQKSLASAMMTIASMQKTIVTELRLVLETQLPIWKFRFGGLIEPVVPSPSFAIRVKPDRKRKLRDLQAQRILTRKDDPRNRRAAQEDFINRLEGLDHIEMIQEAIRARKNMLIVSGTGAGKTTIANTILEEIGTLTLGDRVLVNRRHTRTSARLSKQSEHVGYDGV
jgi:type IV secretory pathway ATPase VirB11/archaellum biosynthesis ATPase